MSRGALSKALDAEAAAGAGAMNFAVLSCGPYFVIASFMDAIDLCHTDASCRLLLALNNLPAGPWRTIGERVFLGMELEVGGDFLPWDHNSSVHSKVPRPMVGSWKSRIEFFNKEVPTFGLPFRGNEIARVDHSDEVAYCRCRLRTDILEAHPDHGVYVEVQVLRNRDNLSLAVVDFEGGGRSSVTFSPETGAVLRERKVSESPRAIEGTFIHLLPAVPSGRRFEGKMGLYLRGGHLAFFRQWAHVPDGDGWGHQAMALAAAEAQQQFGEQEHHGSAREENEEAAATMGAAVTASSAITSEEEADPEGGFRVPVVAPVSGIPSSSSGEQADQGRCAPWETTGFCTDLRWAEGHRLSICLAFRDSGRYRVLISKVGGQPPLQPLPSAEAYEEKRWNVLFGDDVHPLAI